MRNQQQPVSDVKAQVFDVFMELTSENQKAAQKAASARSLRARRGIEDHFEQKRLERELVDFDFD